MLFVSLPLSVQLSAPFYGYDLLFCTFRITSLLRRTSVFCVDHQTKGENILLKHLQDKSERNCFQRRKKSQSAMST